MNTLTDCLDAPCAFAARERVERIEADNRHEKALEEIKSSVSSQTRILAVVVAAASMGSQLLGAFLK